MRLANSRRRRRCRVSDAHVIMLVIKYLINLSRFKRSRAQGSHNDVGQAGRMGDSDAISARIHVTFCGPYPPHKVDMGGGCGGHALSMEQRTSRAR